MTQYAFLKTQTPIRLAMPGDPSLISRSQAKRVLARFDKFTEVTLDFEGVASIGQAFADEIFRVFANEHPKIKIAYTNAQTGVEQMIKRAIGNRDSGE